LQQALVARRALPNAVGDDVDFYQGKLQARRFFFATELPAIEHAARLVREVDSTALDMRAGWF
jgi:butyryl-CoA dehydrogenase